MLIKENLEQIKNVLPNSCKLIAVSKTHGAEKVEEAIKAGHYIFGENKVQEAIAKFAPLRNKYKELELHLIGNLQSNKAAEAVANFDYIHTIDREKIAKAIKKEIDKQGKSPKLFVQVNIGEEESKSGCLPLETAEFISYCQQDIGLKIEGLMCIPPVNEESRLYFALLKNLATASNISTLSMGMSSDWQKALAMGANYIRVGTAIFGTRGTQL